MTPTYSPPKDYHCCRRCGTWRREEYLTSYEEGHWACKDVAWCGKQAGVGKGTLDADTGDPKP